jgi:hypothetical protein
MKISEARLKKYSQSQIDKLMAELDSDQVTLFCGKHNYAASLLKAPKVQNCAECWQAYITRIVAAQAPHERQQFLEALQEFSHEVIQHPDEYKPFLHPEVSIIKDDPSLN